MPFFITDNLTHRAALDSIRSQFQKKLRDFFKDTISSDIMLVSILKSMIMGRAEPVLTLVQLALRLLESFIWTPSTYFG